MVVQTPSKNLVFVIYVKAVLVPAENIRSIFCAKFFNFERLVVLVSGIEHASNLSGLGISPSIDFTTLCQGKGVMGPRSNLLHSLLGLLVEQVNGNPCGFLNL